MVHEKFQCTLSMHSSVFSVSKQSGRPEMRAQSGSLAKERVAKGARTLRARGLGRNCWKSLVLSPMVIYDPNEWQ